MKWVQAQAQAQARLGRALQEEDRDEEEESEVEEELWLVLVLALAMEFVLMGLMALSSGHGLCHWMMVMMGFWGSIGWNRHWSWAAAPLARIHLCFSVDGLDGHRHHFSV
jgi:hypothetical protein